MSQDQTGPLLVSVVAADRLSDPTRVAAVGLRCGPTAAIAWYSAVKGGCWRDIGRVGRVRK